MANPPPPPGPQPPPGPTPPPPPGPQQPPPWREGYYPQQSYYAPGWSAPVSPPSRHRGRGVALIGIGLAVVLVLGGAAWGVTYWLQTRALGEIPAATTATARQVATGHCIAELPEDGQVTRVRLVPCTDPHEAEVVGLLPLTGSWPGQAAVDSQVGRWCEMDSAQQRAGFTAVAWSPSETGWAQGDTEGVCIAWSKGGLVTGSWAEGNVARD